ncbi:MAG: hypothetical protein L0210_07350 [Rhodospirillales bacterium]|nr:hypothetical protein [Rhodospirillales bacterium]
MPARSVNLRRVLILGAGWLLVVLGVVGLFLPFLQGVLFLMVGFYLLSRESARARLLRRRLRARYPGLVGRIDHAKDWTHQQLARLRRREGPHDNR